MVGATFVKNRLMQFVRYGGGVGDDTSVGGGVKVNVGGIGVLVGDGTGVFVGAGGAGRVGVSVGYRGRWVVGIGVRVGVFTGLVSVKVGLAMDVRLGLVVVVISWVALPAGGLVGLMDSAGLHGCTPASPKLKASRSWMNCPAAALAVSLTGLPAGCCTSQP